MLGWGLAHPSDLGQTLPQTDIKLYRQKRLLRQLSRHIYLAILPCANKPQQRLSNPTAIPCLHRGLSLSEMLLIASLSVCVPCMLYKKPKTKTKTKNEGSPSNKVVHPGQSPNVRSHVAVTRPLAGQHAYARPDDGSDMLVVSPPSSPNQAGSFPAAAHLRSVLAGQSGDASGPTGFQSPLTAMVATPCYRAPEVLQHLASPSPGTVSDCV